MEDELHSSFSSESSMVYLGCLGHGLYGRTLNPLTISKGDSIGIG